MPLTYNTIFSQADYESAVVTLISGIEGFRDTVYADNDNRATIGFGYTFNRANNVNLWTGAKIYSTLTAAQQQLLRDIDNVRILGKDGKPDEKATSAERTRLGLTFDRSITKDQATALLRQTYSEYEGPAKALGMPLSPERAAFVAVTYNRGVGAAASMEAFYKAVRDGNRAEAWFQIRYNSLGNYENRPGKAKGRYLESQVFGLYDNPNAVTAPEAYSVFKMFQRHRHEIDDYEALYGVKFDDTNGRKNMIGEANKTPDYWVVLDFFGQNQPNSQTYLSQIDTIRQALDYGKTALINDLHTQYQKELRPEELSRIIPEWFRSVDIYVNPVNAVSKMSASPSKTAANCLMIGMDQKDELTGGGGDDVLIGDAGNDNLWGGTGSDVLVGGAGNDNLIGGKGYDFLYGGADNDTYFIYTGDGTDRIEDKQGTNNRVVFNEMVLVRFLRPDGGNDYRTPDGFFVGRYEGNGDFVVREIASNTQVILNENFQEGDFGIRFYDELTPEDNPVTTNVIQGDQDPENLDDTHLHDKDDGNDLILAGAGDDYIISFWGGEDWLQGGDGDDVIDGEKATNCIIEGGAGSDVLFGSYVDGSQIFGDSFGEKQELVDAGETAESTNEKGDLIGCGSPGGDNFLYGSNGNDIVTGGGGKDFIVGAGGDDLILSDCDDISTIWEIVHDWSYTIEYDQNEHTYTPVINGVTSFDLVDDEGDYDVIYAGTGNDFVNSGGNDDEVHAGTGNDIVFGQGGDDFIEGGDGDDVLNGDNKASILSIDKHGSDYIDGGSGNDSIYGEGGSDNLLGGDGNDYITGDDDTQEGYGDDYIDGGAGDDTLFGGSGSDTILGGDDNDYLQGDSELPGDGDDYLDGGAGNDKVLGCGGADIIYGGDGDDNLQGDSLDTPLAEQGDDYIDGGAGNDTINGYGGNNIMYGGDGNDQIVADAEEGNNTAYGDDGDDQIQCGDGDDYIEGGEGADIILAGDGADTICGDAGDDQIWGDSGDNTVYGDDGDDQISCDAGNDYIEGGAGADTIFAGDGANTIYANDGADQIQSGTGNNYIEGGADSDAIWCGNGNNTVYGDNSFDGDDLSYGDDQIQCGNGDDYIEGGAGADVIVAGDGSNEVHGGDGNDRIWGGGGSDSIDGGTGADIIYAGDGNNTVYGDDGSDQIWGGSGIDTLNGGADNDTLVGVGGADTLYGGDGDDSLHGDASDVALAEQGDDHLDGGAGNDIIYGYGGNDTIYGGDGNDEIVGGEGDDVLMGGAGDDFLRAGLGLDHMDGGEGTDIYYTGLKSGIKHIQDSGHNVLFLEGFTLADVGLSFGSLVIGEASGSTQIHLEGVDYDNLAGTSPIDEIRFSDGTTMTISQLLDAVPINISGTENADNLRGTSGREIIHALAGDDVVDGRAGNDIAYGEEGDDTLTGGLGNDSLYGGQGNDTYLFNLGDGIDTISDISVAGEGNLLVFGPGISKSDLIGNQIGNTLMIRVGTNGDTVNLLNFDRNYQNGSYVVENVQFADGTQVRVTDLIVPQAPPRAGSFTETGNEDTVFVIDGWNYTDANGDTATTVRIQSGVTGGVLFADRDGDNAVDSGEYLGYWQEISWADATSGIVKFATYANWNGSAVFRYAVKDATAYGPESTATVVVNPVPDAPQASEFAEISNGVTPVVIDGWYYSDVDGDSATAIRIDGLPGHGSLFLDSDGDNSIDSGETIVSGQEISWYDATHGLVKFTPDSGWYGSTSLSYAVKDSIAYSAPVSATITVNDLPKALPFTETSYEDGPAIVLDGWGYTEADGDVPTALQIRTQPNQGLVFLDKNSSGSYDDYREYVGWNQDISWADATTNHMLKFVTYENWNGSVSFEYRVKDASGYGYGPTAVVSIEVTPVNDAPQIYYPRDPTGYELSPIRENYTENNGDTIGAIILSDFSGEFYDIDTYHEGPQEKAMGIAVVAEDNSHGTWEYTTNGGANWISFGALSDTSATLLAGNDPNTRIRFVPNNDWSGVVDQGITFHAWDQQTMGLNGQTGVNLSSIPAAFSVETATASISVKDEGPYKLRQPDGWAEMVNEPTDDNSRFGGSVSIDGNFAVVGAYIYRWNGISWDQPQKLIPPGNSYYAGAASIDGEFAIISASGEDWGSEGSAYIFHWDGSSWVDLQELSAWSPIPPGGEEGGEESGPGENQGGTVLGFGDYVSIDGDYAIVGADQSAYVYHWSGSSWGQQQILNHSDWAQGTSSGFSVASLAMNGDYIIIGQAGAAFVYHLEGNEWMPQQTLSVTDGMADGFGYSVSIDDEGYAIVGAAYDDDKGYASGSAYIFRWDGISWVQQQKLIASDGMSRDTFGASVAIDGEYALIGAPCGAVSHDGSSASCSAYMFHLEGSAWVEEQILSAEDRWWKQNFGASVALDSQNFIIGSPSSDVEIFGIGEAYIYGDGELLNQLPIAGAFTETGLEDQVIILDDWNYSDADGDTATFLQMQSLPVNGVLFLDNDGDSVADADEIIGLGQEVSWADATVNQLIRFAPGADWSGATSFGYAVKDAEGYGTPADVTIQVNPVNDLPQAGTFSESGNEDTVIVIDGWNYTDADGDAATLIQVQNPAANGTLFLDSDGDNVVDAGEEITQGVEISWADATVNQMVKFIPAADWNGSTSLVYAVKDASEYGSPANVAITVNPVNDPPQAGAFTETGDEDTVIVIEGWNYTDIEGDAATLLQIQALAGNGTLFLDADSDDVIDAGEAITVSQEISWADATTNQLVKFAPAENWNGFASLSYAVKDNSDYSLAVAVTIAVNPVNDLPQAGAFTKTGNEDTVIVIDGWNFTDIDGDAATVLQIQALPENGTLFLDADQDNVVDASETIILGQEISWNDATANHLVKFIPNANWNGSTSLSYSVKDASDYSLSAAAAITVIPVNDPPQAGPFAEYGNEKSVFVVDGWNYTDVDGDIATSIKILNLPQKGTLFLDLDHDNRLDCGEAIAQGQEISWADAVTNQVVKFAASRGWGWQRCCCDSDFTTTLTYTVSDGIVYGTSAEAKIATGKNHQPLTQCFVESGIEDTVIVIDDWSIKKDKEGDSPVSVTIYSLPKNGVLFLDADQDNVVDAGEKIVVNQEISWADVSVDGLVKFAPESDWHGNTEFLHSVNDAWNQGTKVPAHIMIENDNADGSMAIAFTETVPGPNQVIVVDGWDWDSNGSHSTPSLEITSLPEHGTLFYDKNSDGKVGQCEIIKAGWEVNPTCNGYLENIKFMPATDWTGTTTFTYRMNDRCEGGPEADVTIAVLAPNDDVLMGGDGNDTLDGGTGDDKIYGGAGNDEISGGAGNDLLNGGAGTDSLEGGLGNDTYVLERGSGQDRIDENDSTPGNDDVLALGNGISADQIWLRRAGNDLEVSILGTSDKAIIDDWYRGSRYQVEEFRTDDGKALLNNQVDALVNAMAAFAPPAAGQTTLPESYQAALNPIIAANWK